MGAVRAHIALPRDVRVTLIAHPRCYGCACSCKDGRNLLILVGVRIWIEGSPAGSTSSVRGREWRQRVAAAAAGASPTTGVGLEFTLEPGRWIDLDTVAEVAVAGLRDGGAVTRGLRGLDALLATRRDQNSPGLEVVLTEAKALRSVPPPGPALLEVAGPTLPRAKPDKRVWRGRLAEGWGAQPILEQPVWADVAFGTRGSLLGPLEPTLDALEPVLGRDPRGGRQEFFPHDDRIVWLRVRRAPLDAPPVRLWLGPVHRTHLGVE